MSQPDSKLKSEIAANLEDLDFDVELLEETDGGKTPDLLASKEGERFLVEVKSKQDDEKELLRQRARSAAGQVGRWSEPWAPRNTIARAVREGVQQLAAFPRDSYDFALLWLHADGRDSESQFQQFAHTLFGLTRVFSLHDSAFDYECYYFHESAFFSFRATLDGAIISTPSSAQLCVNTYSPRVGGLRNSMLARALEGGVRDPAALEAQGEAIIADCDADRRKTGEIIGYLQRKYNVELLQNIHVGRLTAWVDTDAASPNQPAGADG